MCFMRFLHPCNIGSNGGNISAQVIMEVAADAFPLMLYFLFYLQSPYFFPVTATVKLPYNKCNEECHANDS